MIAPMPVYLALAAAANRLAAAGDDDNADLVLEMMDHYYWKLTDAERKSLDERKENP